VVVNTGGAHPGVIADGTAICFGELDAPRTKCQLRVRALDLALVRFSHEHEPWRPHVASTSGTTKRAGPPREGGEDSHSGSKPLSKHDAT
jgi:hypothetical protein